MHYTAINARKTVKETYNLPGKYLSGIFHKYTTTAAALMPYITKIRGKKI